MSRFLRLEKPSCYPHFDITNRDTSAKDVFDLGVDLEFYSGSVFLKVSDVQEMARSIGMLSAEDAKLITDENKRLREQLERLPEQAQVLKDDLDRVVADFHARIADPDSVPVEPESEESGEGSTGTDKGDKPESGKESGSDILEILK